MKKMIHILAAGALLGMVHLSAQQVPTDHEVYVERTFNQLTEKFVAQGRLTFSPGPAPERLNGYDKALIGHDAPIMSAHWSPDVTQVVTASADGTARICSAETGQTVLTLVGHQGPVYCAAWSPDGFRVVTGSADRTTRLWNAQTGECLHVITRQAGIVYAVAWSPDGTTLATASSDKTICLWDTQNYTCLMILEGHIDVVLYVEWSPDSSTLLTISRDKTIRTWDLTLGRCRHILGNLTRTITAAHWSPDGTMIATGSDHGKACIWSAATGELLMTCDCANGVNDVAWSPDSRKIVTTGNYRAAHIWNVGPKSLLTELTGRLVHTFVQDNDALTCAAWSPNGKNIATVSQNEVRLWNALAGGYSTYALRLPFASPRSVEWSKDSTRLLIRTAESFAVTCRVTDADVLLHNLKLLENYFKKQGPASQDLPLLGLLAALYHQHGGASDITRGHFPSGAPLSEYMPDWDKRAARIVFNLSDDFFLQHKPRLLQE